jgi:O-antigen ligase
MFKYKKLSNAHDLKEVYVTIAIFAVLAFLQWEPPGFYFWLESFRWYFMVGIAGLVFILQKADLNISRARFYILFSLLSWLGALLSLLRTPLPDEILYKLVSMTIPFFLGLVFIPVISINSGRLVWLGTLIIAALMWGYKVVQLWILEGEGVRHILYGPGMDHNLVALCLAIAATTLMIVALYGDVITIRVPLQKLLKLSGFLGSVFFLICSFLTYSRSGFIITLVGIFFAIFTLILSNRKKTLLVILFILFIGYIMVIPIVQLTNPTWFIKINEIARLDDPTTSVFVRTVLLRKAWGIVQENPFIGIGPGIFRVIYDPMIGHQSFYMVHNTYLATWVENGILGLFGYIVWLYLWARLLFKWNNLSLIKQILLSAFVPFFIMLFFLDIGGFPLSFMLIIFSTLDSRADGKSIVLYKDWQVGDSSFSTKEYL